MPSPESALIIEVPAAEAFAGRWRSDYDPSASAGVPAHITVLYPFLPPDQIDKSVDSALGEIAASFAAFDFVLDRVDAFPGVVWLAPTPSLPIRQLTEQVVQHFPGCPPYGGEFSDVVPHLTLAETNAADHAALMGEIVAQLREEGPIVARADRLSLLVSDELWFWRTRARWDFSASSE